LIDIQGTQRKEESHPQMTKNYSAVFLNLHEYSYE
jgi:hypothetical protein